MSNEQDELRSEYSEELIKSGVRGKYPERYKQGTNVVLIAPDLHKLFPDSESVNRALRKYVANTKGKGTLTNKNSGLYGRMP